MKDPVGILVLDDLVGMMSPDDAETFALSRLKRIFDAFPEQITAPLVNQYLEIKARHLL